MKIYLSLAPYWLRQHPYCEMKVTCLRPSVQIHHSKGRWGKLLNDTRWWVASCDECHRENPNPGSGKKWPDFVPIP